MLIFRILLGPLLIVLPLAALGQPDLGLGYPYLGTLAQGQTVTNGTVSAWHGTDGTGDQFMISAPVQPGNSGGLLLDSIGAQGVAETATAATVPVSCRK